MIETIELDDEDDDKLADAIRGSDRYEATASVGKGKRKDRSLIDILRGR